MKYKNLTTFLELRPNKSPWTTSFKKIEEILGFELPNSAYEHAAWWSNFSRSQSHGWLNAGYKTSNLDLQNGFVTFVHDGLEHDDVAQSNSPASDDQEAVELTIAEAKAGLAVKFGVAPSQIEITIKG